MINSKTKINLIFCPHPTSKVVLLFLILEQHTFQMYYYYYWCTYILARYRKCIVILLPKSLVVSFVLLNLFGLYFMFFLFFIRFNFPTTFFKRRLLKFIIFFRCEKFYSIVAVASGRPNCIYRTYDYYAKRAIRLFHGTFSIVFLYTQSFHFLTYHWIRKW